MLFKRTILIGGGVLLAGTLIFGSAASSYVRTLAGYVDEKVQESIPIQVQIDRARGMLADMKKPVKDHLRMIAKEEVQIEQLAKQIDESQKLAQNEEIRILRLTNDLNSKKDLFRYAGRSYSRKQVQVDLASRFKRYKNNEKTLENLQKMKAVHEKSLEVAREKFEKLITMRDELALKVDNLELQLRSVDAAKMANHYVFDDSQLGQVKELVNDLQVRLQTESKMVDMAETLHGGILVDEPDDTDIVDQVTNYFRLGEPDAETVAASE